MTTHYFVCVGFVSFSLLAPLILSRPDGRICTILGINSHPGNKQFRDWVFERKNEYNLAPNKNAKSRVAQEVYDLVVSLDPPGRFLMREGGDKMKGRSGGPSLSSLSAIRGGQGYWVEIGKHKTMAKVSQALREGAPTIRASAKEGKTSAAASSSSSGRRRKQTEPAKNAKSSTSTSSSSKKKTERRVAPSLKNADERQDDETEPAVKPSRVFPKVQAAPVPAPIVAPVAMADSVGVTFSLPVSSDAAIASNGSGSGTSMSASELLTPDQIAEAEAHFRHGTLIGSPIRGRGKEIIMPPPAPPMIPADSGLPPVPAVAMTQPSALLAESGEFRGPREEDEEVVQAEETEKQLSHVLHLEKAVTTTTPPPPHSTQPYDQHAHATYANAAVPRQSGAAGSKAALHQGGSTFTPTPHLMAMSPMISPTYSLGTPGYPSNIMASPNFATMFGSPGAATNGNHVPAPPLHSMAAPQASASGQGNLNRSHSLSLSDTNFSNGGIDPQEDFKNVFEDEDSNVAYSVGSVSGGVMQNYGGGSNHAAARMPAALPAPPPLATAEKEGANRAIVSPILTARRPTSAAQGVAPIEHGFTTATGQVGGSSATSSGNKSKSAQGSKKDMTRSSHSDTSRSVATSNGNVAFSAASLAAFMVDPTQSKATMCSATNQSYTSKEGSSSRTFSYHLPLF